MSTPSPTPTKLIGSIRVTPPAVQPGESVLIQVLDSGGRPYTRESAVTITINGVDAPALYCQFNQPGLRPVAVRAVLGSAKEIERASVRVEGAPLAFRLTTEPAPTAMPIIHMAADPTNPYKAAFSLATPASVRRILANGISLAAPLGSSAPAGTATAAVARATLLDQVDRIEASLPADSVTRLPTTTVASSNGTEVTMTSWSAPVSAAIRIAPPTDVSYQWDFGDGQAATTTSPHVTHDYYHAIRGSQIAYSFDVKCTVRQDNISVTRTLVLHSAYGLCRSTGVAVPYVTGDVYASFQKIAFSGCLIVSNPEPAAVIALHEMAIVPVGTDSKAEWPAPRFTNMATRVTIDAGSSSSIGVYVPLEHLRSPGPNLRGFTVYYSGLMVSAGEPNVPVRFSWHFRIRSGDSRIAAGSSPVAFNPDSALRAVTDALAKGAEMVSKPGELVIDSATNTVAIALSADARSAASMARVRMAVHAGLGSLAAKAVPHSSRRDGRDLEGKGDPAPGVEDPGSFESVSVLAVPGSVQAGAWCDPGNIPNTDAATAAAQGLACQFTGQISEVSVPGAYQNAQMGDVILTPGDDSAISQLLRGLTPPQYYSHSGIMTQSQIEITHCTASSDRYGDYMVLGGVGGVQPDVLEYGWPGSITQTLDNAISGQNLIDSRNNKSYNINGFDSAPSPDNSLYPPLVIKPLPQNEQAARPVLRAVAATARSKGAQIDGQGNVTFQKGGCYYSFYGYTKPEIGLGLGDPAPAGAGWAKGLTPAVCSAFIWLCMKENGVAVVGPGQYETTTELSPIAIAQGAQVVGNTLDGLFYYPEPERLRACQVLYALFEGMALDQEGIFADIPFVGMFVAGHIADQVVNVFVFGDPNMYGSSKWQKPGDGNAVSPWNISWWNPPLFGWAEPIQYLPPHTEQYIASEWTPYAAMGSISGVVTLDGAPQSGAVVQVYDGMSGVTGPNGRYALSHVPGGSYALTASVVSNGSSYSNGLQGQTVQLTAVNPNVTANIALTTLPSDFRNLVLVCQVTGCDHSDYNPGNVHGVQTGPFNTYNIGLGPGTIVGSCGYSFGYNSSGYFTVGFQVTATLAEDLSIEVEILWTITGDGSGKVQNSNAASPWRLNVPKDGLFSGSLSNLKAAGALFTNGPADFTIVAYNNREQC